jgi:hypothetical protein
MEVAEDARRHAPTLWRSDVQAPDVHSDSSSADVILPT